MKYRDGARIRFSLMWSNVERLKRSCAVRKIITEFVYTAVRLCRQWVVRENVWAEREHKRINWEGYFTLWRTFIICFFCTHHITVCHTTDTQPNYATIPTVCCAVQIVLYNVEIEHRNWNLCVPFLSSRNGNVPQSEVSRCMEWKYRTFFSCVLWNSMRSTSS